MMFCVSHCMGVRGVSGASAPSASAVATGAGTSGALTAALPAGPDDPGAAGLVFFFGSGTAGPTGSFLGLSNEPPPVVPSGPDEPVRPAPAWDCNHDNRERRGRPG